MKKINVINNVNLPARNPIVAIFLWYLVFDKFNAPEWLYGVFGVFYFFVLGTWIIAFFCEEPIDILKNEAHKTPES